MLLNQKEQPIIGLTEEQVRNVLLTVETIAVKLQGFYIDLMRKYDYDVDKDDR